jgi:pre-rRNA-processing protein TSR4
MPLLTQIYAPLDSSPVERVIYTFACQRHTCRGKAGSVRAWRCNSKWPVEPTVEDVAEKVVEKKVVGLDLGNLIFGAVASPTDAPAMMNSNPFAPSPIPVANPFILNAKKEEDEISSKLSAIQLTPPTPLSVSWPLPTPSYPPQYLTTAYEPVQSTSSSTLPPHVILPSSIATEDAKHREGKGAGGRVKKGSSSGRTGSGGGDEWGREGYEVQKVKGVDEVFLRFQERVSREGLQCVRYVALCSCHSLRIVTYLLRLNFKVMIIIPFHWRFQRIQQIIPPSSNPLHLHQTILGYIHHHYYLIARTVNHRGRTNISSCHISSLS